MEKSTKKLLQASPALYVIGFFALLSLALSIYNFATKDKVKYYRFEVIEEHVRKTVEKKTRNHLEGLTNEIVYLQRQIEEDEEAYKKNNKPSLKKKIEKSKKEVLSKYETHQRVSLTTLETLMQEFIQERLSKSLEAIKKKEGCKAILPLQCKVTLTLEGGGEFFRNSSFQANCNLEHCIDPKDDCTLLILKEMGIELESEKEQGEEQEKGKKEKKEKTEIVS